MPPANDDLANRTLLGTLPSGGTVVSGTTVGATVEGWEGAGDYRSVWVEFIAPNTDQITLTGVSASYAIYADVEHEDVDPPTSWFDLNYAGIYFGDGSNNPPDSTSFTPVSGDKYVVYIASWNNDGATGTFSFTIFSGNPPPSITSFTPAAGVAGDTVVITGLNFTGATAVQFNGISAASFTVDSDTQITATVPAGNVGGYITVTAPTGTGTSGTIFGLQHICLATDNPNLVSSTVSISGPYVRDVQYRELFNDAFKGYVDYTETFRCTPGDDGVPTGHYKVEIYGQFGVVAPNVSTNDQVLCQIKKNGQPIGPAFVFGQNFPAENANGVPQWIQLSGVQAGGIRGPLTVGVRPSDVLTFHIGDWGNTTVAVRYFEVEKVRYTTVDTAAPGSSHGPTTTDVNLTNTPGVVYDMKEYGGATGNDHATAACDFTIMPDGTIYAAWVERKSFSYYVILKYWNGSSWSLVSNNVWGHGAPSATYTSWGGMSLDNDGTNVYIAFHEDKPGSIVSGNGNGGRVRVFKYNGALTQMGADIQVFNSQAFPQADAGENGVKVGCAPNGDVYLAFTEQDNNTDGARMPFVYKWNGSAWVDTSLPFKTYRHNASPNYCDVAFVEEFNLNHVAMVFCHHDGPSNYPAILTTLWSENATDDRWHTWIYQEYNGSSWSGFEFTPHSAGFQHLHYSDNVHDHGHWQEGFGLFTNGTSVYFSAQIGSAFNTVDHVIVGKLRSDGTAFDPVTEYPPTYEVNSYWDGGFGGEWGWIMNGPACFAGGQLVLSFLEYTYWASGMTAVRLGESGSGSGWQGASQNVEGWGLTFDTGGSVKPFGKSFYVMNELYISQKTNTLYQALGIWQFDVVPDSGVVSMNWRSSDRGGTRKVLI